MPKPRQPRAKPTPGSLLAPDSTGGITANKGFDFQTRYAACQLPMWLLEVPFRQLFYEGTGDIDIRYEDQGQSSRIHLQVKDHEVTLAEFKEVVAHFRGLDAGLSGVYTCFRLVCSSLAGKLRPLETGLARYRNAKPFYVDAPNALAPTKQDLDGRIRALGFKDDDVAFIESKVFFDVGHADLHHDDRAIDLFIARLLKHPEYAEKVRAAVLPAFAELLRAIQGNRGAVLARADLEKILRAAVASVAKEEKNVTIWIQNWTHEAFDVLADYELDWSAYFDRSTRKVPTEEVWNKQLIAELGALKEKIAGERTERFIRFREKCALSTGIALGVTFPAVGGWNFEIPQPPAKDAWRSDAELSKPYDLPVELTDGAGTDLVLGLNIRGDGREDVRRFIASTGVPPKLFAFMGPSAPGSQSISGAAEACAFAHAVREHLGRLSKSHGIKAPGFSFTGRSLSPYSSGSS